MRSRTTPTRPPAAQGGPVQRAEIAEIISASVDASAARHLYQKNPPTKAQQALTIQPKTAAVGLSGAICVVVLYALKTIWDVVPPNEVAVSISIIVAAFLSWLAPKAPASTP